MQFPDCAETRLTDAIMATIRPHLKQDPPPQENHHYNRTYEAIYAILRGRRADHPSNASDALLEGL